MTPEIREICMIFGAILLVQELIHWYERNRMLDRIMAKDLNEFRAKEVMSEGHRDVSNAIYRKLRGGGEP